MANRCQALDDNGKQCRKKAVIRVQYHGDPTIYRWLKVPEFVVVELCAAHSERREGQP